MLAIKRLSILTAALMVVFSFAACNRDPNVRKHKYLDSGRKFFAEAKYSEAAIEFANAVQVDPNFAEAHYELAKTYLRMQSWSNAYRELTRTVDLQPDNLSAQIDLGNLLLGAHQLDRAEEKAKLVLAKQPNSANALALFANVLVARGKLPEGVAQIQKAIENAPGNSGLYLNLAILQSNARDLAGAEASFRKAVELDPNSVNGALGFAHFYEMQQKWPEAEQELKRAVKVAPKSVGPRVELARFYLAMHRQADAEQVLTETKQALKDDPAGYRLLADYYVAQGALDRAMSEYESLRRDHPNNVALKKTYISLLMSRGQYVDAGKLNDEILKANAKDQDGISVKAQLLTRSGHPAQAAELLQNAIKVDADNPVLHLQFGDALMAAGALTRAELEWREAVRLKPDYIAAHTRLANTAAVRGDADQIALSADQIIKGAPSDPTGYIFRARAELLRKQLPEAEADAHQAVRLGPRSAPVQTTLGQVLAAERKGAEAEKAYTAALEFDPNYSEALQSLILLYRTQNQTSKVGPAIDAQLAKAPNNPTYNFLKASILAEAKKNELALPYAQQAANAQPGNFAFVDFLAHLQYAMGNSDDAVRTYETALQVNSSEVRMLFALGSLYEAKGDSAKAQDAYKKVMQIQPDNALAANNLAFSMLESGGNVDVALTLAQTARQGLPNLPATADTLAWAHYKKGVYQSAVDLLEDAVKKAPNDPDIQYHLGMVYSKLNQPAKANSHFQRLLQLRPNYPHAAEVKKALNIGG